MEEKRRQQEMLRLLMRRCMLTACHFEHKGLHGLERRTIVVTK